MEQHTGNRVTESATVLPGSVAAMARYLHHRRLGRAALLFLTAHQPVAFLLGQGLYFLAPIVQLLMDAPPVGRRAAVGDVVTETKVKEDCAPANTHVGPVQPGLVVDEWAEFCCRPDGLQTLMELLDTEGAEAVAAHDKTSVGEVSANYPTRGRS